MVTQPGRLKAKDNAKMRQVIVQRCLPASLDTPDTTTQQPILAEVVAGTVVDLGNAAIAANTYAYASLPRPVVLEPNTSYYLASYEDTSSGGDSYAADGSDVLNADNQVNAHYNINYQLDGAKAESVWVCDNGGSWRTTSGTLRSLVNLKIQ